MSDIFVCTKENAWNGEGRAQHPDAEIIYSHDNFFYWEDGYERYMCPNCGLVFTITSPSH